MPWNECKPMDERLRFVARLLDGEKMAVVCREFGISRKTGYKLFNRYQEYGIRGLEDRARSPYRHPQQVAVSDRDSHFAHQAGIPQLGRTQDPRETDQDLSGHPAPCGQYDPCPAGPPRPGQTAQAPTLQGPGHRAR